MSAQSDGVRGCEQWENENTGGKFFYGDFATAAYFNFVIHPNYMDRLFSPLLYIFASNNGGLRLIFNFVWQVSSRVGDMFSQFDVAIASHGF
ncbi:hypothetical protein CD683_001100 [Salmonella enterica subsp. enterica serovar Herston]|uniref:Uncharacterized protein n=1 Tax=Salmonella enterica TaxID=28901 RepID=A0A744FS95_SALER|nr:hypothetical protein [Salmonella enterica]EBP6795767.1 hypothetical protein [Salmonella enterica subsp. enterica]EEI9033948.1 hypothetical protein [Salmonella enterica subsp. enterica serovar Herston]EAZ4930074.1 hypothetical protein [Salmonella enterica]EBP7240366.1 hypothetical protein [Salmonella enterica subsp. enterica]EDS4218592.1 hypothetical protein [Salmonella enterica subsp. enterica]